MPVMSLVCNNSTFNVRIKNFPVFFRMGAKKKTTSKIEQPVPASRETSMSDLGFTITGALEIDFPEGMRKHCEYFIYENWSKKLSNLLPN